MPDINTNIISNARLYLLQGNNTLDLIAKAEEIDLPKLKPTSADSKGLGMNTAFKLPTGLDAMEAKIKFNGVYPDALKVIANYKKTSTIIAYASMEIWGAEGITEEKQVKVTLRGFFSDSDTGKFKARDKAESEATMSLTYYKYEYDSSVIYEIDVFNNIYKIGDTDILKNFKQNIGG